MEKAGWGQISLHGQSDWSVPVQVDVSGRLWGLNGSGLIMLVMQSTWTAWSTQDDSLDMYSALPKVCEHGKGSCTHASSRGWLSFVRGRSPAPDFNFLFFLICVLFVILTMTATTTPAPSHNIKDGQHSPAEEDD
ncbi:hypothetical protein O181_083483 [Austropuccinia psidii MF-1]|uniref:Uncharacterized protein n=1 Tax=Austropuccinia psidii MF-1 TaxID=1389203 RepID=A0A9Q3FPG3_9BASI|nr:hypothetical protein [Austropuccinia psidii MF-1]